MELTEQDRGVLKTALLQYKADGVENPMIPLNVDIDGDGINDAFALDDRDELILVSEVHLDNTVYAADGSGTEGK